MTYFDREDLDHPDWEIFQNSWVVLYWRPEILSADIDRLSSQGYKIFQFDGEGWLAPAGALSDIGTTLAFPNYYGRNLDAFNRLASRLSGQRGHRWWQRLSRHGPTLRSRA